METAITQFLEVQPMIEKIQENIDNTIKLAMKQEKFKDQVADSDQQVLVKPFTLDTNNSSEATSILSAHTAANPQQIDDVDTKMQQQQELSRRKRREEALRKKNTSMIAVLEAAASRHKEIQKHQNALQTLARDGYHLKIDKPREWKLSHSNSEECSSPEASKKYQNDPEPLATTK
jgi:hypothetical protein